MLEPQKICQAQNIDVLIDAMQLRCRDSYLNIYLKKQLLCHDFSPCQNNKQRYTKRNNLQNLHLYISRNLI